VIYGEPSGNPGGFKGWQVNPPPLCLQVYLSNQILALHHPPPPSSPAFHAHSPPTHVHPEGGLLDVRSVYRYVGELAVRGGETVLLILPMYWTFVRPAFSGDGILRNKD